MAGAEGSRPRHRRSRTRPVDAAAAARRARPGDGERSRPLSPWVERIAEAVHHQPLAARQEVVVVERRARQGGARHTGCAGEPSLESAPVLALRVAEVRRLSLSVSSRHDLPARAAGRARDDRADGSADAWQSVSQRAGGVLSRARQGRAAARHPRDAGVGCQDARCRARSRRVGIRRGAGAGHSERMGRRSRRTAARSRHLGPEDSRGEGLASHLLRVRLRSGR